RLSRLLHCTPLAEMAPSTAVLRPERQSSSVLLPAPDGPMMTSSSPGRAAPLTLLRICLSSTCLVLGFLTASFSVSSCHCSVILGTSGSS
ncbi:hypothetical protein PHYSODRAFT_444955, partial [Phytophthora sojae]